MKLTKKQIDELTSDIVILIDTREKNIPNHVTQAFDKHGIKWERRKLKSGDYTAVFKGNEELGLQPIDLEDVLCIERKMNAEELGSCISTQKDRFSREFKRTDARIILLIENCTYGIISKGLYKNDLTANQYLGLLHGLLADNENASLIFMDKKESPRFIWNTFKYYIRNILNNQQ